MFSFPDFFAVNFEVCEFVATFDIEFSSDFCDDAGETFAKFIFSSSDNTFSKTGTSGAGQYAWFIFLIFEEDRADFGVERSHSGIDDSIE